MARKPKVKSIRGVEIHPTEIGAEVVYIRFQADGRQHRERIGPLPEDKRERRELLAEARRQLRKRREQVREARLRSERWLSPAERAEQEARKAQDAEDARQDIVFENAAARFLERNADSYSRPSEVRTIFEKRIAQAFKSRYLDEITRREIRDYLEHRRAGTGPFASFGPVGFRPGQIEMTKLSALYGYLIDEEQRDLQNPCLRPRSRRRGVKKSPTLAYPSRQSAASWGTP